MAERSTWPTALALGLASAAWAMGLLGCPTEPCPPGEVLDEDVCRPAECGAGTWGSMALDERSLRVDANAQEGGDGSEQAPFRTIAAALDVAALDAGSRIALAAGTYREPLHFGPGHVDTVVAGRCAELVTIDGGGALDNVGIELTGLPGTAARVTGVRVIGFGIGVRARQGELSLEGVTVSDSATIGVVVTGEAASASIADGLIEGTRGDGSETKVGTAGTGVQVTDGGTLSAERTTIAGNRVFGLWAGRSGEARMVDCSVRETAAQGRGAAAVHVEGQAHVVLHGGEVADNGGVGISVIGGGTAEATSTAFEGNRDVGVRVEGNGDPSSSDPSSWAVLDSVRIRSTREAFAPQVGLDDDVLTGAVVYAGGSLWLRDSLVEDNESVGVGAHDPGTVLDLSGSVITGTLPGDDGELGIGLAVTGGATAYLTDSQIEDSHYRGLLASGDGTSVDLTRSDVRGTRPAANAALSWDVSGVEVNQRAELTGSDCRIEDNEGRGVKVVSSAHLDLNACDITGSLEGGLSVGGAALLGLGATARLTGGEVSGTDPSAGVDGRGVAVHRGGRLVATGTRIADNWNFGLTVSDASVDLTDVTVSDTHRSLGFPFAAGVVLQGQESSVAEGLVVESSDGLGLWSRFGHSTTCTDCDLIGNSGAGAAVQAGELILEDCTISATGRDPGVGGGVGVWAEGAVFGGSQLEMSGCLVQGQTLAAIYIDGRGRYELCGNEFAGGEGFEWAPGIVLGTEAVVVTGGVRALGAAGGLALRDNLVRDSGSTGVLLDGSAASLFNNVYDNPAAEAVDVVQQACDLPGVEPIDPDTADALICEGPYRRFVPVGFDLLLDGLVPPEGR